MLTLTKRASRRTDAADDEQSREEQSQQSAAVPQQSAAQKVAALTVEIKKLFGVQSGLLTEAQRCDALAEQPAADRRIADEAREAVVELNARKIAGKEVPDADLIAAEQHARESSEAATRGDYAARGAALAAQRYRNDAGVVEQQIVVLQAQRSALLAEVLAQRADAARATFEDALDAFERAQIEFSASEDALRGLSLSLRLPAVTDKPLRVRDGSRAQYAVLETQHRANEIAAELRGLLA